MTNESLIDKLEKAAYEREDSWGLPTDRAIDLDVVLDIIRQHTAQPSEIRLLDPDMPTQQLRLHMGELTRDEILVARAAIGWANSVMEDAPPANQQPVDSREAFEKFCDLNDIYRGRHKEWRDQYELQETQLRWMGFQAAWKPERESGIEARAIEIDFEHAKPRVTFEVPPDSAWGLGKYRITPVIEVGGSNG